MKLAESVVTQFRLHLQIHGRKIAHRQLVVTVLNQQDKFSYIHKQLHLFWSPRVFSAYSTSDMSVILHQ